MLHPLMCYNLPQLFLRSLFDHLCPALLVLSSKLIKIVSYCHLEGGQNKTLEFFIDFSAHFKCISVFCKFHLVDTYPLPLKMLFAVFMYLQGKCTQVFAGRQ